MKKLILFSATILLSLLLSVSDYAVNWEWALYGSRASRFSNGLADFYSAETHKNGYIDVTGKTVIPAIYDQTDSFSANCAVVKKDGKQALIDRQGKIIFDFGKYEYYKLEKAPNAYRVKDVATGKLAYFDGVRFLTGFDYQYIDDYGNYPFISLSSQSKRDILNALTGELYSNSFAAKYGSIIILKTRYNNDFSERMYARDGNPMKSAFENSSEGVYVFKDESTKEYGLKDKSGNTIVPAKYKNRFSHFWINDVVVLIDSISPKEKYVNIAFNKYGKEILRAKNIWMDANFIYTGDIIQDSTYRFYDNMGNRLKQLDGRQWISCENGYYYNIPSKSVYYAKTGKIVSGVEYFGLPSEGMRQVRLKNSDKSVYYFLNDDTHEQIGPYAYANDFHEGLAVVEFNGDDESKVIDKKGKVYSLPSGIKIEGDRFQEGVISATDKSANVHGLLYNPLGHDGWAYTQKAGEIHDAAYRVKWEEAGTLFEAKKYAQAKDIYYLLAMLRPKDNSAFNNYACCLYNLGLYAEAETAIDLALRNDPSDEYALNLKSNIAQALNAQYTTDYDEAEEDRSTGSVWSALGDFANAMMGIAVNMAGGSQNYYATVSDDYSSEYGSSNYSSGNYQQQYNRWASVAERHYNSITNLGSSFTSRSGKKHGHSGQGASPSNYVMQKRQFREAQKEMRRIRTKARNAGITIMKSQYEDASISY